MKFAWILVYLFTAILAAPSNLAPRGLPVKPSEDPFYDAPDGFESKPLGSILKMRKMTNSFGVVVIPEKIKEVYQYLVRSEDSLGDPIAVVTTLFIPYNADPKKLLSYQAAEDAVNIDCSPSYAMQLGANPNTIVTAQVEQLLAQAGLNQGWYVVVPDHQGPKNTYVASYSAGYAVLNSIRAVLSTGNSTGIDKDARVTLWGYSGGSLGSEWGAMLQPSYAPEINLVGSAFGGVIVDIDNIARHDLGSFFAGFVITAINGLANEYPEIQKFVKDVIYENQWDYFTKTKSMCLVGNLLTYPFVKLSKFTKLGNKALDAPEVKKVTDANNALTGLKEGKVPKVPLFIYNSKLDEIIPTGPTDKFYKAACDKGVDITYMQDLVGGHGTQAVAGAGSAFVWLKERMNGVEAPSGCKKTTKLTNAITRKSLQGLGEIIVSGILTLLQNPVGPFWGVY